MATMMKQSHAASLILKVVARSWNTLVTSDSIYMPDLIKLLKTFPTLAVPFLADQIKLAQKGERFYLRPRELCVERCTTSQWVRAAVSIDPIQGVMGWEIMAWETRTQEYLDYMAKTYVIGWIQSIIERPSFEEICDWWWRGYSSPDTYAHKIMNRMMRDGFFSSIQLVQHVIPVRSCNTIELLEYAVALAESQGSALLFKS
jgi:hypothetical protein